MTALFECGADPGLPTLAVVLDPAALCKVLDELLPPTSRDVHDLEIRVLRHHPGKRCAFRIAGRGAGGPRSWIGKVYAADRSDVHHAMVAIQAAGFGPDAEFSIPEPIAYLPDLRFLLQEDVVGPSATDRFLSAETEDGLAMSERCAVWLARFHTLAPASGPILDLAHYQLSIERWARRIAAVEGVLAEKADQLRGQLEHAASGIRDTGARASHGTFTHHHVIAANGRTVTFDLDDHAVADPGLDVARFIVGLWRLALRCLGSIRALDAAANVFLTTYLSRAPGEIIANLPFYAGAICLRLVKQDIGQRADRWSEKAEATLDEGLRVLQRGL